MAEIAGLTQKGSIAEILSYLVELQKGEQGGGGKSKAQSSSNAPMRTTADASAAPIGQPTATAGVNTQQAPVPAGAPPSTRGGADLSSNAGTQPTSTLGGKFMSMGAAGGGGMGGAGGGGMGGAGGGASGGSMGAGASAPAMSGQGGGYTNMGSNAPSTGSSVPGKATTPEAGGGGGIGGWIAAAVDDTFKAYETFSMDEQEKAQRAQRHLMEQQFEMRANFNDAYYRYFLPAQAESSQYAAQQLGKGSENYEYAATALKGYIEGTTGVLGGQKEWDEVFQDIGEDLDDLDNPPEDWMSAFQSHMENDTVPYGQQELVNQILKGVFKEMGIPYHLTPEISQAIVRWGGAMIGASKDMRSQGGSKGGVAYNGSI